MLIVSPARMHVHKPTKHIYGGYEQRKHKKYTQTLYYNRICTIWSHENLLPGRTIASKSFDIEGVGQGTQGVCSGQATQGVAGTEGYVAGRVTLSDGLSVATTNLLRDGTTSQSAPWAW